MKNLEDCTVCRLCLDIVSNETEDLQSINRDMQGFILPEIDLDLTCEPKICTRCWNNLQTCYEFKSICLKNSGAVKKNVVELVARPVNTENMDPQPSVLKLEQEILKCCLCHIAIHTVEEFAARGDHFLKTMLKKCFPEIEFQRFSPPCEKCLDCLENLFMFTTSCLNTEENIKSYCFTKGIHSQSKIDLQDVYSFIQSSIKIENESNSSKIMYSEDHQSGEEVSEDSRDSFIKIEPKLEEKNEYSGETETPIETNKCDTQKGGKTVRKKRQYTKHINKTGLEDSNCPKGRNTTYKCAQCFYETNRLSNMKTHLVTHKDSSEMNVFYCDICSYKTKCKTTLNTHRILHRSSSEATMYKCTLCKFETKNKRALKTHISKHKNHTEKPMLSCNMCKYQTQNKYCFKRHKKVHGGSSEVNKSSSELSTTEQSDVRTHKCNTCEYQTEHAYELEEHQLVHIEPSEDTVLKCNLCSYETIKKRDFKRHMSKHKGPSEVMAYKCDICRFKTKHQCTLETHMLKHKDIKMYSCDICKYETKNKSHFLDHSLVHKDPWEIKMFKCDVCSHETKRKRDLNKHVLRHAKP